jgi:hypothetical protein
MLEEVEVSTWRIFLRNLSLDQKTTFFLWEETLFIFGLKHELEIVMRYPTLKDTSCGIPVIILSG